MTKYKWLGIAVLVAAVAGVGLTLRQVELQAQPQADRQAEPQAEPRAGAQCGCCSGGAAAAAGLTTAQPAASQPASVKAKFVNARCPIMGGAIDPPKVPASLTRVHKGQNVAFCCGMCLPTWDKLSPEQKDAKLDAAGRPGK